MEAKSNATGRPVLPTVGLLVLIALGSILVADRALAFQVGSENTNLTKLVLTEDAGGNPIYTLVPTEIWIQIMDLLKPFSPMGSTVTQGNHAGLQANKDSLMDPNKTSENE